MNNSPVQEGKFCYIQFRKSLFVHMKNLLYTVLSSMRIRQAMFPEIPMDDGSNVPIPQMDPTANTAVQRLSQPSQMVKNAVVDLINYQVSYFNVFD